VSLLLYVICASPHTSPAPRTVDHIKHSAPVSQRPQRGPATIAITAYSLGTSVPRPPSPQQKLTFCSTISDTSSLEASPPTSPTSSRHARHRQRSVPQDPPRTPLPSQPHTPPHRDQTPTSSTPVPRSRRPAPPQPRDLGDVYDLDASLVSFRFSTTKAPKIHTPDRGVEGSTAKWYYVIVGRTVGIYNEWYVPTPSGTVFPLTCLIGLMRPLL
jgi:hypothetical protein